MGNGAFGRSGVEIFITLPPAPYPLHALRYISHQTESLSMGGNEEKKPLRSLQVSQELSIRVHLPFNLSSLARADPEKAENKVDTIGGLLYRLTPTGLTNAP